MEGFLGEWHFLPVSIWSTSMFKWYVMIVIRVQSITHASIEISIAAQKNSMIKLGVLKIKKKSICHFNNHINKLSVHKWQFNQNSGTLGAITSKIIKAITAFLYDFILTVVFIYTVLPF